MIILTICGLLNLHTRGYLGLSTDRSAEQNLGDGSIDKNIEVSLVVVFAGVKVAGGSVVTSTAL